MEFFGKTLSGPFTIPSGIVTTATPIIQYIFDHMPEVGVVTTKSIGLEPRAGNREPIYSQYAPGCFVNADVFAGARSACTTWTSAARSRRSMLPRTGSAGYHGVVTELLHEHLQAMSAQQREQLDFYNRLDTDPAGKVYSPPDHQRYPVDDLHSHRTGHRQ